MLARVVFPAKNARTFVVEDDIVGGVRKRAEGLPCKHANQPQDDDGDHNKAGRRGSAPAPLAKPSRERVRRRTRGRGLRHWGGAGEVGRLRVAKRRSTAHNLFNNNSQT